MLSNMLYFNAVKNESECALLSHIIHVNGIKQLHVISATLLAEVT